MQNPGVRAGQTRDAPWLVQHTASGGLTQVADPRPLRTQRNGAETDGMLPVRPASLGYWQIPMVFGPANCAVENPLHVVPLGHPVPPTTQNFAHAKPNPIGDVHR